MRVWLIVAGISGAIGAAMGAVAAHLLAEAPLRAALIATAQQYQLWHALALGLVALAGWQERRLSLTLAGWAFLLGTLLFCGGLYLQALGGRSLGPLVPLGGSTLIAGWLLLAFAGWRTLRSRPAPTS